MKHTTNSPTSDDIAVIRSHVQRIDRRLATVEEALSSGDYDDAATLMVDARENLRMISETLGKLAFELQATELIESVTKPGSAFHLARSLTRGGI